MSAENAWRIAREILATMPTKYLARCPMPPVFEAAFRAEETAKVIIGLLAIADRRDPGSFVALRKARALLSRLEAKGESHD